MKKKILITVTVLIFLLAAAAAGMQYRFRQNHVEFEGQYLPKDMTTLTLSGPELPDRATLLQFTDLLELDVRTVPLTIRQYEQLRQDLPHCKILWLVPFQGSFLSPDTQELTVTELSAADFESIPYLPNLTTIHAEGCQDYGILVEFQTLFPQIDVYYEVTLQEQQIPYDTEHLILHDADIAKLSAVLPYLSSLRNVVFEGNIPDSDGIYGLMCQYPQISFQWDLTLFGITTPNTATELILSDIPMPDTSEVESYLKYFPNLERVEMCNCGISSEDMDALSQRYPDIRFVWEIKVRYGTLRTDAIAFIPYKLGYDIDNPLYDKDCTELKYCIDLICLDMGHMKIKDVSFLYQMPNMKYLILGDTPVKDFTPIASLKELIYLEIFNVQFTQHELLLELTKLEDLNLGSTPTKDIDALKQMTWLKRLWVPNTKLNGYQFDELTEALPNTQVVTYGRHSTDRGWRDNQNYRDMRDLLGMWYMQ